MNPISTKTKLISIFVLAFLCLNAGGAFCLAYCQSTSAHVVATEDHCPLPKGDSDCHHTAQQPPAKEDASSVGSGAVTCCSLAINVLVAPIERKQVSQDLVAAASEQPVVSTPVFAASSLPSIRPLYLRPLVRDRRFERIKNRVFRI